MSSYYTDEQVTLHHGDALAVAQQLPDGAADCIVTSPPYYGLRDYGMAGQYGQEATPDAYVAGMQRLFSELRRVLAADGTLWLNIGDSYATGPNPPPKNLHGIPWRVALALQADGWILRNAIVWSKPNAMPEAVTDRLAGRYELLFLLTRSARYWFDLDPIREAYTGDRAPSRRARTGNTNKPNSASAAWDATADVGRNPGDVWVVPTQPFAGAHFAVMPLQLAQRCIAAGCKPGGTVLDPFSGSGTTGAAAQRLGRKYVGIDLNADYLDLSLRTRLREATLDLG